MRECVYERESGGGGEWGWGSGAAANQANLMDLVDDVWLGEVEDVIVALEALWVGLELLSWSTYMYTYTQDKTKVAYMYQPLWW